MRRDACRRLTEKAMLLVIAARKLPASVGEAFDPKDLYRDELMTFSGFVGADMEMAEIRYRLLEYRSSTRMHSTELLRYVDTAEDASECVLMCSPDELLYVRCTHIFTKTGKQVLTFERRVEIKQELRKFLSRGCEIRSYAEKEQNGDVTFLGFIAYAERIRKETVHAFGALSDLGIRSFLILD